MNAQAETKTADDVSIDEYKITLVRSLGLTTAILMVAGTIIGSGIFKKIAPMSAMLMNENYILLILFSIGLVINTLIVELVQFVAGLIFICSGIPLYYYYRKKNKLEEKAV